MHLHSVDAYDKIENIKYKSNINQEFEKNGWNKKLFNWKIKPK